MTTSRVALVTGASSGIGQATAALLAKQGFQVFGTSRAPTPDSAGTYDMLPLDVGSETSVQACVQIILQRTGRIDLLVNNAGYAQGGAFEENSLEEALMPVNTATTVRVRDGKTQRSRLAAACSILQRGRPVGGNGQESQQARGTARGGGAEAMFMLLPDTEVSGRVIHTDEGGNR